MRTINVLAAIYLALPITPAAAFVTSTASITDLRITLFDLDVNDNIAPSITFAQDLSGADTNSVNGKAWVYSDDSGELITSPYYVGFGAGTSPTPLEGSDQAQGVGIDSYVSTSPIYTGPIALNAHGFAEPTPGTLVTYIASANAPVNNGMQFVLSPHTVLVFSGWADLTALTATGGDGTNGLSEEAAAFSKLTIHGVGSSGHAGSSTQSDADTVSASTATDMGPQSVHVAQRTSVSFVNASEFYINGALTAQATASGHSNVAAVPEPTAVLLSLAGIAVVAAWGRRRRQLSSF